MNEELKAMLEAILKKLEDLEGVIEKMKNDMLTKIVREIHRSK